MQLAARRQQDTAEPEEVTKPAVELPKKVTPSTTVTPEASDETTLVLPPATGAGAGVPARPGPGQAGSEALPQWLTPLVAPPRHGDPILRRVHRSMTHAVGGAAAQDVRGYTEEAQLIQQPITTSRRILVAGLGGGVGATTIAALLSSVFAHYRTDGVLAADVTLQPGSLEFRLRSAVRWPAWAVSTLTRLSPVERADLLAGRAGKLCVLPRPEGLELAAYWEASTYLTRYFGLAVLDGGVAAISDMRRWEHAHAVLVALPATVEGVGKAAAWLARIHPELRPRVIPVLMCRAPDTGLRPARVVQAFRGAGSPAIWLGYDRNLAAGASIAPQYLGAGTVRTAIHATARALVLANGMRLA